MKYVIAIFFCLFYIALSAFSENIVQIATTTDTTGHWNNWAAQAVTWDNTVVADVPDHQPSSTKALQTWHFPVTNGFISATFIRKILGVYAIRWSQDGELWSEPTSVIILKPGNPRAN